MLNKARVEVTNTDKAYYTVELIAAVKGVVNFKHLHCPD
jgi:hypothetical protein